VRLYTGHYSLGIHFSERPGGKLFHHIPTACPFKVVTDQKRDHYWRPDACAYVEDCDWQVNKLEDVALPGKKAILQ
jgi:hypothetical protein